MRLAQAGWRVVLAEQLPFPRQKVCGECLPAGAFALLDELGVGTRVRQHAGPALTRVGWMDARTIALADMPPCAATNEPYGRALGRDLLDSFLMDRARAVGVDVRQPARVTRVRGGPGEFRCEIARPHAQGKGGYNAHLVETVTAALVIDAHGSWERGPQFPLQSPHGSADPAKPSDLFAFKATFTGATLATGLLPVFALAGGYGGMVVSNDGCTTVALCLRRDRLREVRLRHRGAPAGEAVQQHLLESCRGAREALRDAGRQGGWLAVGPLRPGRRVAHTRASSVSAMRSRGAPAGGEGMRMALQSSRSLVTHARGSRRNAGPCEPEGQAVSPPPALCCLLCPHRHAAESVSARGTHAATLAEAAHCRRRACRQGTPANDRNRAPQVSA